MGHEYALEALRYCGVRQAQAHGLLVRGDAPPPASADRLGGPVSWPGSHSDAGPRPLSVRGAHRTTMSTRSFALVCVAPVNIASPHASRIAVASWATSPFRKLTPFWLARSLVDQSTRPPAIPAPPSEPSVSANIAAIPSTPSRASAAPIAAAWLAPPFPSTQS